MKLGIVLPQHDSGRGPLLEAARLAERSGLDSVWAFDNLKPKVGADRLLECWTVLAAVAAVTERITVGPLVMRATLRNPKLVGHMASSLEALAPRRVVMGLGMGDESTREEMLDFGYEFGTAEERGQALSDCIGAIRAGCPATPIWLGGVGQEVLSRLGWADGWSYWGPPEGFSLAVRRARKQAGEELETSWGGLRLDEPGLAGLRQSGATHAILAVGARNYTERIEWLASHRS